MRHDFALFLTAALFVRADASMRARTARSDITTHARSLVEDLDKVPAKRALTADDTTGDNEEERMAGRWLKRFLPNHEVNHSPLQKLFKKENLERSLDQPSNVNIEDIVNTAREMFRDDSKLSMWMSRLSEEHHQGLYSFLLAKFVANGRSPVFFNQLILHADAASLNVKVLKNSMIADLKELNPYIILEKLGLEPSRDKLLMGALLSPDEISKLFIKPEHKCFVSILDSKKTSGKSVYTLYSDAMKLVIEGASAIVSQPIHVNKMIVLATHLDLTDAKVLQEGMMASLKGLELDAVLKDLGLGPLVGELVLNTKTESSSKEWFKKAKDVDFFVYASSAVSNKYEKFVKAVNRQVATGADFRIIINGAITKAWLANFAGADTLFDSMVASRGKLMTLEETFTEFGQTYDELLRVISNQVTGAEPTIEFKNRFYSMLAQAN